MAAPEADSTGAGVGSGPADAVATVPAEARRWVPRQPFQSPGSLVGLLVALYGPPFLVVVEFALDPARSVVRPLLRPTEYSLLWTGAGVWVLGGLILGWVVLRFGTPNRVGVANDLVVLEWRGPPWQLSWREFYRPIISLGPFGAVVRLRGERDRGATLLLSRDQAWEVATLGRYAEWSPVPDPSVPTWMEGRFRALRGERS